MKCWKCHHEIEDDSVFCPECGSQIANSINSYSGGSVGGCGSTGGYGNTGDYNSNAGSYNSGNMNGYSGGNYPPSGKSSSKRGLFVVLGIAAAVLVAALIYLAVVKFVLPGEGQKGNDSMVDAVSEKYVSLRGTVASVGGGYELSILEPAAPVSIKAKSMTGQNMQVDDIYTVQLEAVEELDKFTGDEVRIKGEIRINNNIPVMYADTVEVISSGSGLLYTGAVDAVHNELSYINGIVNRGNNGYELAMIGTQDSFSICAFNMQGEEERVDDIDTLLLRSEDDFSYYIGKEVWAVGNIQIYNGVPMMEVEYLEESEDN